MSLIEVPLSLSFRHGMLAGVLFIVTLLGGVAAHGWWLLEGLVGESRENNQHALRLTAVVQVLAERTVDMERSARQFLVLGDPALRERFDEHYGQSISQLKHIDLPELAATVDNWRQLAAALRNGLEAGHSADELAPLLVALGALNDDMRQTSQRWIDKGNARLLDELERQRAQLRSRLALALAGVLLAALAMAWWLIRPVRQLEKAIVRLGGREFNDPVLVEGPADLRRLGARLDDLRQRLAELEADRERNLRHVSHELKTPLTALKEGIALLAEEVPGPLAGSQREVVDILAHNVGSLQNQIESLLTLNAAAFEARHLNMERVRPAQLLSDAAKRHELAALARHIRITVEAGEGEAWVDVGKMAVILDNLLANAIDFSPDDARIRLSATPHATGWRIDCVDSGPGVAPEDVRRIFEPFVQGRRSAPVTRNGSGVGLSIVRELVRALGGRVDLIPSESGAHFRVELNNAIQAA